MMGVLATVVDPGGEALIRIGVQLLMLGILALVLGSVRFLVARRSRGRLVLMLGMVLLSVGVALGMAEWLGVIELSYYPGWREGAEELIGNQEMVIPMPAPEWWEPLVWWGESALKVGGLALACTGLVLDARQTLREGGRAAA